MKARARKAPIGVFLTFVLMAWGAATVAPSPTSLSLSLSGTVLNAGTQDYSVQGGTVVLAMVDGQQLDPGATLQYALEANVTGLEVTGQGDFTLNGTAGGAPVLVSGSVPIQSMLEPIYLPLGCAVGAPAGSELGPCNSAIPSFFQGNSTVQVTMGAAPAMPQNETMQFESPYLNPWGAPIIIASSDSAVVIAATYWVGTIQWGGSVLGGQVSGSFGTAAVSGMFNMTSNEVEDLVNGTAIDAGQMSYFQMNDAALDASGRYTGASTIPLAGAVDCSNQTGIPYTCSETGFVSAGSFVMQTGPAPSPFTWGPTRNYRITGTYQTTWGVPAVGFLSTVNATAMMHLGPSGFRPIILAFSG